MNHPAGSPKWNPTGPDWMGYYPEGMQQTADILYDEYNNYYLIQTESGICEAVEQRVTVQDSVKDIVRVDYYSRALESLLQSKASKAGKVLGCLFWAHIDNLEWMSGFTDTFGCYYCNYWGPGEYGIRNPKMSAGWMAAICKHKVVITTKQVDENKDLFSPPINKALIPKLCDKNTPECDGNKKPLNSIILTNAYTMGQIPYNPYTKTTEQSSEPLPVKIVNGINLKQSCNGTGETRTQWRSCSNGYTTHDYNSPGDSHIVPPSPKL